MKELKAIHAVSYTLLPHSVEGTVRVIHSNDDLPSVKEGEVIVIPRLDMSLFELIPSVLYNKAIAVIGEAGGGLCHLAIILRELDKPCLLLENASQYLTNGKRIKIALSAHAIKGERIMHFIIAIFSAALNIPPVRNAPQLMDEAIVTIYE